MDNKNDGQTTVIIAATGMQDDKPISYRMWSDIDIDSGLFHGTYEVEGVDELTGNVPFRRLAKRGWDLKLKWGPPVGQPIPASQPTVPRSIYELGKFDFSIDSQTIHIDNGENYASHTRITGNHEVAHIDIIFRESAIGDDPGFALQTSFSLFENAGPGRIRFTTRHRDAAGEHAITNGLIYLNGNPEAVLNRSVRTNFRIEFEPTTSGRNDSTIGGRFKGAVEEYDDETRSSDTSEHFKTYDHSVTGAGAILAYKYVPEISTLGLKFERFPEKEQLPAFLRSEDGQFSAALRIDSSGALQISALVEVEHSVCNDSKCSVNGQFCVTSYFWRCYCVDFQGAHWCSHQPCQGGGGGVEPGAVDFSASVPAGEW